MNFTLGVGSYGEFEKQDPIFRTLQKSYIFE